MIVTGEAYDNEAEFSCAHKLMGITVHHNGRLHLHIDARADGSPSPVDTTSLARALATNSGDAPSSLRLIGYR